MRGLRLQSDLTEWLINWREPLFCNVTELFRKMFQLRSLWTVCLLSKMGHQIYPMVQCRRGQGIHYKTRFCWHGLEFSGPQRKDRNLDPVTRHKVSCCRFEEVFSGYWWGFSVRTGRPLNHCCTVLNPLKKWHKNSVGYVELLKCSSQILSEVFHCFLYGWCKKQLFRFCFVS